jgi:hypothetical protein
VSGSQEAFDRVVAAAARLQSIVPDAVLVGGTASALHAGHRVSLDDDHVLADLGERFDDILATLEASEGWVTQRVRPGKVILGNLDGIETGVLQLRRARPLEVVAMTVRGHTLRVPSDAEMVRVKAWMVVWRNATRDLLDVVALAQHLGLPAAGATLARMDDYYADQREGGRGVTTQLVRTLADPRPYDLDRVDLVAYRQLVEPWRDWEAVKSAAARLSTAILARVAEEGEDQ